MTRLLLLRFVDLQASTCLKRLLDVNMLAKLAKYNWDEINLFISTEYKVQLETGVYIPHDFKTDELIEFLDTVNLEEIRKNNLTSREHLKVIENLVQEVKRDLKIHNLILSNQFKAAPKTTQTQVFHEILKEKSQLKRFNFGLITVSIGEKPDFEFDSKLQILHFPLTLTYDKFLEFITNGNKKK